jgi:hypothetical protein
VSALAVTLASVFVFTGIHSPAEAFFVPRILIYAAPARRPAQESQTFNLIYSEFERPRRTFGGRVRVIGKRIGPIQRIWARASALRDAKLIGAYCAARLSLLPF